MNKEKTAMQILIEEMRKIRDAIPTNTQAQRVVRGRVVDCIMQAKSLLEKEQEQIENAFDAGVQCAMTKGYQNVGKDYYQSNYGGEE